MTTHIPNLPQKDVEATDDAKVIGQVMLAFLDNLQAEEIRPVLEEIGVDAIDPETWYPQQMFADIYSKLETMPNGTQNIVAIGVQTLDELEFPDEVDNIAAALQALPQMYSAIHQNIPDTEGWVIDQIDDQHIQVTFQSPYSDYAAYGYLFSIARRFRPEGYIFSVIPDIKRDGTPATFNIKWKKQ